MVLEQQVANRVNIEGEIMHKAKVLAIHCIDLRFQQTIDQDLEQKAGYGHFDRIAWPGASLDFDNVKKSALISLKLHDPDQIEIYEHEDCGAYGNDNSPSLHKANAQRLADALIETKPDLKVETLLVTFDGIQKL